MLFIVMMSLRIIVDLSVNLDEFVKDPKLTTVEKLLNIFSYYSNQSVMYVQELGGIIIVISAAFTLGRMNHTNELTAMLASGVSLRRVVFPLVMAAIVLDVLIVLDQEYVVPAVAPNLVRSRTEAQDVLTRPIRLITDDANTCWLADRLILEQRKMENVTAICRDPHGRWIGMATAVQAFEENDVQDDDGTYNGWSLAGTFDQPAVLELPFVPGSTDALFDINPHYRMPTGDDVYAAGPDRLLESFRDDVVRDGRPPEDIHKIIEIPPPPDGKRFRRAMDETSNVEIRYKRFRPGRPESTAPAELHDVQFVFRSPEGKLIAMILADRAIWRQKPHEVEGRWRLTRGRIFIPTELTSDVLALQSSSNWLDFMSTSALADLIAFGRVKNESAARLEFYSRVTLPIDNIIMLLLGLPFILSRERNIKASAALCLLVTASFLVFVYLCQYTLGATPLLAAWLPVLIFGPLSAVMLDSVKT